LRAAVTARNAHKCWVLLWLGISDSKKFIKKRFRVGPAVVRRIAEHPALNVPPPTSNAGTSNIERPTLGVERGRRVMVRGADPTLLVDVVIALSLPYHPQRCADWALAAQRVL
jgi:hypothetical protein